MYLLCSIQLNMPYSIWFTVKAVLCVTVVTTLYCTEAEGKKGRKKKLNSCILYKYLQLFRTQPLHKARLLRKFHRHFCTGIAD